MLTRHRPIPCLSLHQQNDPLTPMGKIFTAFRVHNDGSDDESYHRHDTSHDKHGGNNDLTDDNITDFYNQRYVLRKIVIIPLSTIWPVFN